MEEFSQKVRNSKRKEKMILRNRVNDDFKVSIFKSIHKLEQTIHLIRMIGLFSFQINYYQTNTTL